jgi:hypothetical protein
MSPSMSSAIVKLAVGSSVEKSNCCMALEQTRKVVKRAVLKVYILICGFVFEKIIINLCRDPNATTKTL